MTILAPLFLSCMASPIHPIAKTTAVAVGYSQISIEARSDRVTVP